MRIEGIPADTTPEAARVQRDVYRSMPAERKFALAFQMSDSTRRLADAGVRSRHPDYSEEQVRLAVAKLYLGPALFRQAFPGIQIQV